VLRTAAASGDRALYDRYAAQLAKVKGTPEEYYRFLNALAWFQEPALVQRTLEFAVSSEVRTQDGPTLIALLLSSRDSRDAAWTFTKGRWAELTQRFGTFQGIPTIVSVLGNFCSPDRAAEVREFFKQNPVPPAARSLSQSLERIESCATLDARQSPPFARWLSAQR
jgi:hypothetical protein